jgi:hypothetical protein
VTDKKQNILSVKDVCGSNITFDVPSPYALTGHNGALAPIVVSSADPFFSPVKKLVIWSPRRQFGASSAADCERVNPQCILQSIIVAKEAL